MSQETELFFFAFSVFLILFDWIIITCGFSTVGM